MPIAPGVELYTCTQGGQWALGKLIILLIILNYLFLFIIILIILIILINCTPLHMVGNGHGQAHNLAQIFCSELCLMAGAASLIVFLLFLADMKKAQELARA